MCALPNGNVFSSDQEEYLKEKEKEKEKDKEKEKEKVSPLNPPIKRKRNRNRKIKIKRKRKQYTHLVCKSIHAQTTIDDLFNIYLPTKGPILTYSQIIDTIAADDQAIINTAENAQSQTDSHPDKDDLVTKIIVYLNEKTGRAYRPQTNAIRKIIQARLNEGYSFDDFKLVIDDKTREWKGKKTADGRDMSLYLRPQTLFAPSHFEEYRAIAESKMANNPDLIPVEQRPGYVGPEESRANQEAMEAESRRIFETYVKKGLKPPNPAMDENNENSLHNILKRKGFYAYEDYPDFLPKPTLPPLPEEEIRRELYKDSAAYYARKVLDRVHNNARKCGQVCETTER